MNNKSSETLASIIVAYRSLGLFKDQAREAMIELYKRKSSGDTFDYDGYIKDKLKGIPKTELNQEAMAFMNSIIGLGNIK